MATFPSFLTRRVTLLVFPVVTSGVRPCAKIRQSEVKVDLVTVRVSHGNLYVVSLFPPPFLNQTQQHGVKKRLLDHVRPRSPISTTEPRGRLEQPLQRWVLEH